MSPEPRSTLALAWKFQESLAGNRARGAAGAAPPGPYLLLMKLKVTGSPALLEGVAQHSVRTTLSLLFCLQSPTSIVMSSLADTLWF